MKKILNILFPFKQPKPSLLSLSIQTFTNETFIEQIMRQGRLYEFQYKAKFVKQK